MSDRVEPAIVGSWSMCALTLSSVDGTFSPAELAAFARRCADELSPEVRVRIMDEYRLQAVAAESENCELPKVIDSRSSDM